MINSFGMSMYLLVVYTLCVICLAIIVGSFGKYALERWRSGSISVAAICVMELYLSVVSIVLISLWIRFSSYAGTRTPEVEAWQTWMWAVSVTLLLISSVTTLLFRLQGKWDNIILLKRGEEENDSDIGSTDGEVH